VTLSSSSLSFGNQTVNTTSAAQTVTVTNTSAASVTFAGTAVSSPAGYTIGTTCNGATLTPNETCTVTVSFAPTSAATDNTSVTLTDNAANSPQSIALAGTGVAAPPVTLSASSLSFGNETVGTTSAPQVVTVANSGTSSVTFPTPAVAAVAGYSVVTTCSGATLTTGQTCTVTVSFKPTVAGAANASLSLTDNAANSPQSISLSGAGILIPNVVSVAPRNGATGIGPIIR